MSSDITAGLERKLRSVQDLIEQKQFKKALKQCNQFIKKSPSPMLLCLKAYALQKLGEDSESLQIIEEIMTEKPSNSHLLKLIGLVYKGLGRTDRFNQIQLESFLKSPSRELGEQVFNSYSNEFNYKEQYNVALKLYKHFSDPRYGLWAVESMILVAMHDPSSVKLLDLAFMMLGKIKQAAEYKNMREVLEIEIIIEENRGKFEKVVEILRANRGIVNDSMIREVEALEKLNRLEEALSLLSEILDSGCSDLKVYYKHAKTTMKIEAFEVYDSEKINANLSWEKFEKIIGSEAGKSVKRTARLGQIFILTELLGKGKLENSSDVVILKLLDYIKGFYDIPSAVEDVKTLLVCLKEEEREKLLQNLEEFNLANFETQDDLNKILTFTKLCFKFSRKIENEKLVKFYNSSLSFEEPPKKGEHRQGDYFLMARSLNYPLRHHAAQFELESGINQSKYNYFLKLQLIENYTDTEFVRKIVDIYDGLDIKSVQHESLGYLVFSELNDWRIFKNELGKLLTSCEKLHKYYALDLADTTSQAYFYSQLSQILDFAKFKDQVDKSLYFNMTQVCSLYLELQKKLQEGPLKIKTDFLHTPLENFTLNIDENVLNDYVPINLIQVKKKRFGRWSDFSLFDIERLFAAFVCEFLSEEEKAKNTANAITESVKKIETSDFYKNSYDVLSVFIEALISLKSGNAGASKTLFTVCLEKITSLESLLKNFDFWLRFERKEEFVYEGFVSDLKKISFLFNTFSQIFSLCLSFAKPLIPAQKSRKKEAKITVNQELSEITKKFFKLFDECLAMLNNEEFLLTVDNDLSIPAQLSEILLPIDKQEKTKEIIQVRRLLIKEMCTEIHTVKSSSSTLLSKSS